MEYLYVEHEGYNAFLEGKPLKDNPYIGKSMQEFWERGWLEAKSDYTPTCVRCNKEVDRVGPNNGLCFSCAWGDYKKRHEEIDISELGKDTMGG